MTQAVAEGIADQAPQWWSMAARWLGWRPEEFWRATPGELRGALREPTTSRNAQGPSMEMIAEMLERDKNG